MRAGRRLKEKIYRRTATTTASGRTLLTTLNHAVQLVEKRPRANPRRSWICGTVPRCWWRRSRTGIPWSPEALRLREPLTSTKPCAEAFERTGSDKSARAGKKSSRRKRYLRASCEPALVEALKAYGIYRTSAKWWRAT